MDHKCLKAQEKVDISMDHKCLEDNEKVDASPWAPRLTVLHHPLSINVPPHVADD